MYKEAFVPRTNDQMTAEEVMRIADEEDKKELEERRRLDAIQEKQSLQAIQQMEPELPNEEPLNPNNPPVSNPPRQDNTGIPEFLLYGTNR